MDNGFFPSSLQEALEIRSAHQVIPYGGGTDLMIEGQMEVPYLFVGHLAELCEIKEDENYLRIGGSCTFTDALNSPLVPQIMKDCIAYIAAPGIRNAGTMAGNIGNGSAKADTVHVEYVADAKLVLSSVKGERIVSILDFYKGRKQLDLRSDELITEILMPKTGLENYTYHKVGARNALAISRVSFAGILEMDGANIKNIAIAFGAVENTVTRHKEIEQMLIGKTLEEAKAMKEEFIAAYDTAIEPIKGRVSGEYRKKVCMNLLRDFLVEKGM